MKNHLKYFKQLTLIKKIGVIVIAASIIYALGEVVL